ncbi:MAG: hypothetical protein KAT09_04385 [Candidatus Aegiribacteria sp.]|nr:hypothetical protein [Candidatus Aegiribacteria sp.]
MRKNVKVIASLVRKARRKLNQGKRDEALEIMKKAVNVDDNNGVLVQVIRVIGKKKPTTEPEDEPVEVQEEAPLVEQAELELVEVMEEAWVIEQAELEPVEVMEEAWVIEQAELEPEPEAKTVKNNKERKVSMASEDQLNKLFEASEREYNNGHQQKAIAYLKRARKLNPDNPEILSRINLLKTKIKSANLVKIARKKLESGEAARAVVLARQAFNMRPDTEALDELLSDLENQPGISSAKSADRGSAGEISISSGEYITVIRELVQDNSLEEAASVAKKAFEIYPYDDLVVEFVDNFKKLGLLE